MKVTVVGTGYVGLVTGTCLSEYGHSVTCLDIDEQKIQSIKNGIMPIYEPNLESLVLKNVNSGRLKFTTDYAEAIKDSEVAFIAVGTPPKEDGSADLQYVVESSRQIAEVMTKYLVIVNKSTVPVGTGKIVKESIKKVLYKRKIDINFDIISNPEFLREGVAVNDFLKPDRIVIGSESLQAKEIMHNIYSNPYNVNQVILDTNIETAELIKYASNAFLATKISFINEISVLCEVVGADVKKVALGMGLDHRINKYSLYAGAGYGGSCFPKDTKALIKIANENGCEVSIVKAAEEANKKHKLRMADKIIKKMQVVKGKKIAVLGLAFKPETDDIREAPATVVIKELIAQGAVISAYDPVAMQNADKFALSECAVEYAKNEYEAVKDCDAVVIITEWAQFRSMDLEKIASLLKGKLLFDLRNMFEKEQVIKYGLDYVCVGRN